jgi:hypothetical protein
MPGERTGNRRAEQPVRVRFGPGRLRLEEHAGRAGRPLRSSVRDAVRKHPGAAGQAGDAGTKGEQ